MNTYHHLRFPHSRLRGFFYAPPYHIPYVILFFSSTLSVTSTINKLGINKRCCCLAACRNTEFCSQAEAGRVNSKITHDRAHGQPRVLYSTVLLCRTCVKKNAIDCRVCLHLLSLLLRCLQLRFHFDSTAIGPPFHSHSTAVPPRYDHS